VSHTRGGWGDIDESTAEPILGHWASPLNNYIVAAKNQKRTPEEFHANLVVLTYNRDPPVTAHAETWAIRHPVPLFYYPTQPGEIDSNQRKDHETARPRDRPRDNVIDGLLPVPCLSTLSGNGRQAMMAQPEPQG